MFLWLSKLSIIWSGWYNIQYLLSHIDNAIQFGEDAEVKFWDHDPELGDAEDIGNFDGGGFNNDVGGFNDD